MYSVVFQKELDQFVELELLKGVLRLFIWPFYLLNGTRGDSCKS